MSIKIKLLLAACLLLEFTNSAATDDNTLAQNVVASTDGKEVISDNQDEIHMEDVERIKRLSTAKLKESLDKISQSVGKSLNAKLDSSLLESIRTKTKIPSLLDYKSIDLSKRINLSPLLGSRQTTASSPATSAAKATVNCQTATTAAPTVVPNKPAVDRKIDGTSPSTRTITGTRTPTTTDKAKAEQVGDAKPIVLPEYLMDKDTKKTTKFAHNRITAQQLKETSDLRNEINYAVKHNIYVHSSSDVKNMNQKKVVEEQTEEPVYTEPPRPAPSSFESFFADFWDNLVGRSKRKKGGPILGSARSDFSYVSDDKSSQSDDQGMFDPSPHDINSPGVAEDGIIDDEEATVEKMMAKVAAQAMNDGIVSNTVESYANNLDAPQYEVSQVREELNLTSITEDMKFNIGENVIGWRTLQRSNRESHALIGLTNSSVILVQEKDGIYTLQSEVALLSAPTFFVTFTYWNQTQSTIDGIVIVSIQHELVFLRVNEAMDKMEFIWLWPTINTANYIHHFVIDNSDTLLIISDLHGGSSASLYRFDMNQRAFFLRESLMLKTKAKNMALVQNGYDVFMCFPQEGHAVIYKYVQKHFKYFTKIESQHAEILSSFEMGGHAYLAIGGNEPKILRYHRGNFVDQTILSKSWGFVEFFLPVAARTYRDDLILFVQHRMDYGSHTNSFVEALIWNGQAFHPALSVPCIVNDHVSELGIGCILDQDREWGIIGATTFQRNRTISVLVPRHEAPSGLFYLQTDLLPAVSTMNEHLLELFSEVIILLGTRDEVLKNAREFIATFPKEPAEEITIKDQNIDTIYTQELELDSFVPSEGFFLGDELITVEKVNEFLQLLNETETDLKILDELNRGKRESEKKLQNYHLKSVNVSELHVKFINGIPTEDFIFVENDTLTINGTVVLTHPLEVENVERSSDEDSLRAEAPETTLITGDLNFDEINGIKWKDLIEQIVMKNLPGHLDEIEVNGAVFAHKSITDVRNLNGLPFPDDYVRTDGADQIVVTGQKTFENVLVTEALDCFGTINNVDTSRIITLNSSQLIPGTTQFRHLEVTESLTIDPNGTISGRHLDEFLSNPTLRDTNQIHANCIFNTLEIEGSLYVQNTIDDIYLDDLLDNVVYKHEPSPKINSFKRFQSIEAPNIQLTTKLINDIPLSSFLTTDTEQTFNVNKIHANVYFQRLHLDGLFDFINVTELDMNAIKLFGDQYTDAELIFQDGDFVHIDTARLDVLETINNIDVKDFISIDENFELPGNIAVHSLKANQLIVGGEIQGSPENLVNGIRLQDLVDLHFSKHNDQNITEPMFIQTVVLRGGLNADFLNGFDFKDALKTLKGLERNEQLLNKPNVVIDQMFINGSVFFTNVNGFDMEKVKANAIRLDQPNVITLPIVFLDPIYINGNMTVDHLNGQHFDTFVADLVRKSSESTRIYGTTIFKGNVSILNNLETTTINDAEVGRILTKNFNREIRNPIYIYGDVYMPQLIVEGKLNGISAAHLDTYSYDEQNDLFVLRKNVYFNESIQVKYLNLEGGYNNIGSVKEYLKDVIRTDRPAYITGTKTFTGPVHIESNIEIGHYKGVHLPTFLSNVVLIDQYRPIDIYTDVVFEEPVIIPHMEIGGDLITSHINNCSMVYWVEKSIRKDRPFSFGGTVIFPPDTFVATNIYTQYLNGYFMGELLTLYTAQNFSDAVHFGNVYSSVPIRTNGLVSGYDLPEERRNTLMVYGDQYLSLPTIFSSIRVLNNLVTEGKVNGRDLKLVATLQGGITVDSPLSFGTVSIDRLYTNDLMSGINFNEWTETALQRWKEAPQYVTAPWTIREAEIDTMVAYQGINGMDVNQFMQTVSETNTKKYQDAYKHKCVEAQGLISDSQNNKIFLSHFEKSFALDVQSTINSIYIMNAFRQNYLLINAGCQTSVYLWDEENKNYTLASTAVTGDVTDWIHVQDADHQLFLISNNDGSVDSNCSVSGASIWAFTANDNSIVQEMQFGRAGDFRSMQKKPNSHSFFYVIRNSDNHVIEYDLRGAIVTEWALDSTEAPITSSVRFVPHEANLGLALSSGNQLSLLTACNCTKRVKRCGLLTEVNHWENLRSEHQQYFEKSIAQLRSDLDNGRTVLKSILMSNKWDKLGTTSSGFDQTKVNKLKEIIDKSKERTAQILSALNLRPNGVDDVKVSSVATDQSRTTPTTTEASLSANDEIKSEINGELIVGLMNAIDEAIVNNKTSISAANANKTDSTQTDTEDGESKLGSGADIVNLLDIVDKIIDENRRKNHKVDSYDEYENEQYEHGDRDRVASQLNRTEMHQLLNDSLVLNKILSTSNSSNETDPQVGSLFGMLMLEKTLAHTLDRASKFVLGDDEKSSDSDSDSKSKKPKKSGLFGLLSSTHHGAPENSLEILKVIEEARHESEDTQIGFSLHDAVSKIKSVAKKIAESIEKEYHVKSNGRVPPLVGDMQVFFEESEVSFKNSSRHELSDADIKLIMNMMSLIDASMAGNGANAGQGTHVVHLMGLIDKMVNENHQKREKEESSFRESENENGIDSQFEENESNHTMDESLESRLDSTTEHSVGSGAHLVDLIDLIDKIIEKNREKHRKEDPNYNGYEDAASIASQLDTSELGQRISDSSDENNEVAATATPSNISDDSTVSSDGVINLMELIEKVIEKNREKHQQVSDSTQTDTEDGESRLGSGADIVNLLDIVDKIIDENRRKNHKEDPYDEYENEQYEQSENREKHQQVSDQYERNGYPLASALNRSELMQILNASLTLHRFVSNTNFSDGMATSRVGSVFGTLLLGRIMANKAEMLHNQHDRAVVRDDDDDGDSETQPEDSESNDFSKFNDVSSELNGTSSGVSLADILTMISEAENITNEVNSTDVQDPTVGDEFGDMMFKLTPVADNIFDKVIDEIQRRRKAEEQNGEKVGDVSPKMSSFFKKIGRSMVKVYTFGKKHFRNAHGFAHEVKYLYDIYFNHKIGAPRGGKKEIKNGSLDKATIKTKSSTSGSSDQNESAEYQKEMEIISKMMPNPQEFMESFAIEMIKTMRAGNKSESTNDNFWSVVKNSVITAFEMHSANSSEIRHVNQTTIDRHIFNEFKHKINTTFHSDDFKNISDEIVETDEGETETDESADEEVEAQEPLVGNATEDPLVGDEFGDLFEKFTPLFDFLTDKIVDELRNRKQAEQQYYEYEPYYSDESKARQSANDEGDEETNTATETADLAKSDGENVIGGGNFDENREQASTELPLSSRNNNIDSDRNSARRILDLISQAENITNEASFRNEEEPFVGHEFGDELLQSTPSVDDILDEIADEMRRKIQQEQYQNELDTVGSPHIKHGSDVSSRISRFFKRIGNGLVKVYVLGKDRFRSVQHFAADAKYLYDTYYFENAIEDNKNDNKTYGPTESPSYAREASGTEASVVETGRTVPPEIEAERNTQKQAIDHRKDMEMITKTIPNAHVFIANYSIEIIKSFADKNGQQIHNQSSFNSSSMWSILRNGVKSAFDMHGNDTRGDSKNETETHQLILADLMHRINETYHEVNRENISNETVGSTFGDLSESTESETENPVVGDEFGDLFEKFTPLVDFLSDKVINELRRRKYAQQQYNERFEPNNYRESQNEDLTESSMTSSGCNRHITMKEFEEKLNELKKLYSSGSHDELITPLERAKPADADSKLELPKTNQMDTTVVSIPSHFLPSHHNREIVAVRVGANDQLLIAVTSILENKIKGDHDRIQIFEDVVDGKLFQTISCFKPRSLTAFTLNMDTILAFIQDENEVKTYIFRGVQGFVEFTSFRMPSPIKHMAHNEIMTHPTQLLCPEHYLILVMSNQAVFIKAVTIGDCQISHNVKC